MTDIAEKKCSKCKELKPFKDFGNNRAMKFGLDAYCLACRREHDRKRYYGSEKRRADLARNSAQYAKRYPEKVKARSITNNAIDAGRLVRGPCEHPGCDVTEGTEAHHDDYSLPLEVRWLCSVHHGCLHAKMGDDDENS